MANFDGWTKERVDEILAKQGAAPNAISNFVKARDRVLSKEETLSGQVSKKNETFQPAEGVTVGLITVTKPKSPTTAETIIQQDVIKWFRLTYPEIYKTGALFAVPNEGKRTRATAGRMKAEGLLSNVSDLVLLLPRGAFHGACIEMKSKDGVLRPGQKDWLSEREKSGYATAVCYSYDDAVWFFHTYLKL